MPDEVAIVGRGRLGAGLAGALRAARWRVRTTSGRRPGRAVLGCASIVVLAVPDPAIEPVAASIARGCAPSSVVLHVAGSRGPDVLEACRARGLSVGVMHPLASFAGGRVAALAGATFVLDGDRRAIRAARRIVRALAGRCLVAPVHGPAYHAAAALAANGATALASCALDVLVALGFGRRDAERAIGALLGTVAANVATVGIPAALTGPIARGDATTVAAHRAALEPFEGARSAYDAVAPIILGVAMRAGLEADRVCAIERALR